MDITLFEEVNIKKLKEVINCDNIPFENTDDKEWINIFKKQLSAYSKKKYTSKGFEIRYTQPNKYGRYMAKIGLQLFQKDVRKYISGEFVRDFDFTNCHPILLEQLLKKNDLYCGSFLEEYNNNRTETIKKYNLRDKTTLIKIINNEASPSQQLFEDLHNKIYKQLIPKLLKDSNLKAILTRIKKQRNQSKKNYNHLGSFFSNYLQHIENGLLMSLYSFFIDKNIKVHTLCFDGLTIERCLRVDEKMIKEAENHIFKETGYNIKIQEKSTLTDWVPSELTNINMSCETKNVGLQFSREHLDTLVEECYNEEGLIIKMNCKYVVEYLNNFMCLFQRPWALGFRFNTNEDFEIKNQKGDIITTIGDKAFSFFMKYDCRLQYIRPVFIVDKDDPLLKKNVYNSYQRPKFIECIGGLEELKERCPLFIDFLKRIISDNDDKIFTYLLNYMSKIVQVGNSKQCLVLKGKMGTGKSTMGDILKLIVENEKNQYSKNINDISDLMSRFNSLDYQCILTTIEEVVTDAGSYHSVQNKLKDLITNENIKLEKKGLDAIMVPSQNNIIIITNNLNPVEITGDNRRFLVLYIPNYEQCNSNYFVNLKKQVVENIEYIRGFLYSYKYEDNLNNIRPITKAELNLLELNKPAIEQFIEEHLNEYITGLDDNSDRMFSYVYNKFCEFCSQNQKKALSKKYFSLYLKENGYYIEKKSNKNTRYIYKTR